jgi:hypothetical protein
MFTLCEVVMKVSEVMRAYRESKGQSQQDLARRLKVPPVVVAYLEEPEENNDTLIGYLASVLKTTPLELKRAAENCRAASSPLPPVVPVEAAAPVVPDVTSPAEVEAVTDVPVAKAPPSVQPPPAAAPAAEKTIPANTSQALDHPPVEKFKHIPHLASKAAEPPLVAGDKPATYPAIRKFLLDPQLCRSPGEAAAAVTSEPFSSLERKLVLHLSTVALYHFCDTSSTHFAFEKYLAGVHGALLARLEKELAATALSAEEKTERLQNGRCNIFYCERVERLASLVLEKFAAELEEKLLNGDREFGGDLHLPFCWEIDATGTKIAIRDGRGSLLNELELGSEAGRK